ncbi:MAG: hypothetical protein HY562_12380 [Ignavibacteriales bacterium]|nr:hypothetical protein [Ignavibacteriales bacterium]
MNALSQGRAILLSQKPNELIIDFYPSIYHSRNVAISSKEFLYFDESGLSGSLPQESFLLGIPPSGNVRVTVLDAEFSEKSNVSIAFSEMSVEGDSVTLRYMEDDRRLRAPAALAKVTDIFALRYQKVAVVRVDPLKYDRNSRTLRTYQKVKLKIDFHGYQEVSLFSDPPFEKTYQSLLVNYDQATQWRLQPLQSYSTTGADSRSDWFDPSKEYIRMAIGRDGIYKVTFEDLQAANVLPLNPNPLNAELFYRGVSIAFRFAGNSDSTFSSGEYFEFWGQRLYDSLNSLNEFSDTSLYWLTFDGNGSRRPQINVRSLNPTAEVSHYEGSFRAERDSFYFYGNGPLPANNNSAKDPGEGWYWRRLLANQATAISFIANNFYRVGNPPYTISGKLHSPVVNQVTPNHRVEVRVNGTPIGEVQFRGYSDTVFAFSVASNLFVEGANSISLYSYPTGASINEVFIDWVGVKSLRELSAARDSLFLQKPEGSHGQVARFMLSSFNSDSITVYKIEEKSGIEKVFSDSISGSAGNFTISFSDTIQNGKSYLALTDAKKLSVQRIEKKNFINLRSSSNDADYLVVTSKELSQAANSLAAYRSQKGIGRTKVVYCEDIYDEFSFGSFDPFAIRRFLQTLDSLWTPPKPAYIVLLGDANWDYKDNLETGKRNLVPSLGNPISDAWFVESDTTKYLADKQIGRIPAQSLSQAQLFVNALITYESLPLTHWNKQFLFMASGFDSVETTRFQQFWESMINQYIIPSPISGSPGRLYKTVTQVIGEEQSEEAKRLIEEGGVWLSFYGHGGTDLWGNGITVPDQLRNRHNRRHLISDISCSTARFGEPLVDSFGEKMLFGEDGGTIGYLGSSGFGFEGPLRAIASRLYAEMALDSVREIGSLLLRAKVNLWHQSGAALNIVQQALQQMTLLGDPATRLAVALKPDYALVQDSVVITPSQPTEADQEVVISVPVFNFGLKGTDSITVRWMHTFENEPPQSIDQKIAPVGHSSEITFSNIALLRGGSHRLQVTLDASLSIDEVTKSNNNIEFSFFVGSTQLQIISPIVSSSVHPDSVTLVVQNPNLPYTSTWQTQFEIDTSSKFNGDLKLQQFDVPVEVVTTRWQVPAGVLKDSTLYFWRARMHGGSDSTSWVNGYFVADKSNRFRWVQDRELLFEQNKLVGVHNGTVLQLLERHIPVEVISAGFGARSPNDVGEATLYVDNKNISATFSGRGYNVAIINQFTGEVESFGSFDLYSNPTDTLRAEPLIRHMENIPYGRKVLVAVSDEGAVNKTERVNRGMESIGSSKIRSLGFRYSWAIIGWKGAPVGSVPESLKVAGSGAVTLSDTLHTSNISGSVTTNPIGPAVQWNEFGFEMDTTQGLTHISLDVIRAFRDGSRDTIKSVELSPDSIRSKLLNVEKAQFVANLRSDSAGFSPTFRKWWADFTPPAELAFNYQTVQVEEDSVLEGHPLNVDLSVYNIGYSNSDTVSLTLNANQNNAIVELSRKDVPPILPGQSTSTRITFLTTDMPGRNNLFLYLDPLQRASELYRNNNVFSFSAFVKRDSVRPSFEVTFDGSQVFDGDYVSPNPTIMVSVFDNSPLPVTNPSDIAIELDGRKVSLGSLPDSLFESRPGPEKAVAVVRPTFSKGEHVLSVQVRDASGNFADTSAHQVRFRVETDSKLLNVFNYPNPFARETNFTFNVTGSRLPEDITIKVYTVAGRLIQEIRVPQSDLRIGFNRVLWDGRDREGDELANGVYFYKIIMVAGEQKEEVIQKLAKIR